MELRQLNSFCQIVQCGTLKDAAKRCFLTPSAVSQQIKTLEHELGLKLFKLKGRKLALTPKGKVFYCDAKKILDSVHEAGEKARHQTDPGDPAAGRKLHGETGRIDEIVQQPMVLLQSFTTTRAVIDGAFRKKNLGLRTEMEASTCVEVKRYVANAVGLGIVHDICIEPEDNGRFRTISLENIITHPRARLIYSPAKSLSPAEKKLIGFIRFTAR